ncbi:MAG TPA: CapA family protein [Trueperaceae bacterium]|nr:CapA family protein [Trueperaceae bacterium]
MITFLGDVFPARPVALAADLPGTLVLNLEAPLTDSRDAYPGKINLRGSADAFAATFAGREVVATLANNHCMDFREAGLHDTIAALDALGVPHCGAGTAADGWRNPAVVTVRGTRVAVLAYADPSCTPVYAEGDRPGAAPLVLEAAVADIAAARAAGADRVVVAAHWGEEQVDLPTSRCVALARALVDAGADAVVGHHAHCIQSYETYRGKPVMYGLGNCVFPAHDSPSYYDAAGRPTRVQRTRPSPRNRRSLALVWDPATGEHEVRALYFDGSRLVPGRFPHRRYRLRFEDPERHDAAYAVAYRRGKVRHALESFAAQPKLPRLAHLRNVSRLLRTSLKP